MDTLTDERLEREFEATKKALDKIKVVIKKGDKHYKIALEFLDTAQRYYKDALYFKEKCNIQRPSKTSKKRLQNYYQLLVLSR